MPLVGAWEPWAVMTEVRAESRPAWTARAVAGMLEQEQEQDQWAWGRRPEVRVEQEKALAQGWRLQVQVEGRQILVLLRRVAGELAPWVPQSGVQVQVRAQGAWEQQRPAARAVSPESALPAVARLASAERAVVREAWGRRPQPGPAHHPERR